MYSTDSCFFFQNTISNILKGFPGLFTEAVEDDEPTPGADEQNRRTAKQGGLGQFGIIPYLTMFCKETNEKLTDVMSMSLNFVLYIVSYVVERNKEEEKQLKKIRNKNY